MNKQIKDVLLLLKITLFFMVCLSMAGCILGPDATTPRPAPKQENTRHELIIKIDKAFVEKYSLPVISYVDHLRMLSLENPTISESAIERVSKKLPRYVIENIKVVYSELWVGARFTTEYSYYTDYKGRYEFTICCFANFDALDFIWQRDAVDEVSEKILVEDILATNEEWTSERLSSELRDMVLTFSSDRIALDFNYYIPSTTQATPIQKNINLYLQRLED